jgi:hypothetical protein
VAQGTGTKAALPDRPAAGKTGTTENYGDAWFVGYTPQLVTAVWVGYPNKLVPMSSQFHGQPVAGGTFPALIWKSFMEKALRSPAVPNGTQVQFFKPPTGTLFGTATPVVWRGGQLEADNGNCRDAASVQFYPGRAPTTRANCKPNEVDVPWLVGRTVAYARLRLELQPLTPAYVYKPAKPRQRVDIVVAQYPSHGTLSSYDKVTLVVPRALFGVVPNLIGLDLRRARDKLHKMQLLGGVVRFADGKPGLVVAQTPPPGVAAAPNMKVSLIVGRAA